MDNKIDTTEDLGCNSKFIGKSCCGLYNNKDCSSETSNPYRPSLKLNFDFPFKQ